MSKKDEANGTSGTSGTRENPSKLCDLIVSPSLRQMGPRNTRKENTLKPFMDRSSPCVHTNSVAQDMIIPPQKKFVVTRAHRLEQFLWHEFYHEYLLATERLNQLPPRLFFSEYTSEFGKDLLPKDTDKDLELEQMYPLYGSDAISVWNKNGDRTCSFRRAYTITQPLHELDTQFG